jgi:hypothetical protein
MNQQMAQTIIYGNTDTHPERFRGLTPRYNTLANDNVINAGGTGDNTTSVWLVAWGEDTVFGLYPKGQTAGLQHKDLGEVTLQAYAADGVTMGQYQGYRSHYVWRLGLAVRDWRYIVRIVNIPTTQAALANVDLVSLMIRASEQLPSQRLGKPVFYVNKNLRTLLRLKILEKQNVHLTFDTVEGHSILKFDGIPVRRVDSLLNTETALT